MKGMMGAWVGVASFVVFLGAALLFAAHHQQYIDALRSEHLRHVKEPMRPYHYVRKRAWESLLVDVTDALDNANIPFFLSDGTALGILREGYFTPTDHDVDIGIFYEGPDHVQRIVQALNNTMRYTGSEPVAEAFGTNLRWHLQMYGTQDDESQQPCGQLMLKGPADAQFDIFFWFPLRTAEPMDLHAFYAGHVGNTGSYYCSGFNESHPVYYAQKQPFRTKRIRFLGRSMRIADEMYLKELYGATWRTPRAYHYSEGVKGAFESAQLKV